MLCPAEHPSDLSKVQQVAEETAVTQAVTLGCFRKGIQAGLPLASPTRSIWPRAVPAMWRRGPALGVLRNSELLVQIPESVVMPRAAGLCSRST